MDRKFALSKFRSDIGGSCPFDREKILSTKAAQTARQCPGKTLAIFGGSLSGLVDRDAVWRLAKGGPNAFADDGPQHWLNQLLSYFQPPFIVFLLALATIQNISSPDDLKADRRRRDGGFPRRSARMRGRGVACISFGFAMAFLGLRSVCLTRNWRRASPARGTVGLRHGEWLRCFFAERGTIGTKPVSTRIDKKSEEYT